MRLARRYSRSMRPERDLKEPIGLARTLSDMRSLLAQVLSAAPDDALREISDRRIWGRFALAAWRQRVGGVVCARLRELNAPVPDDAMRELAAYARRTRESNRVKLDRVLPVVHALEEVGVRCMFLKGAALLASIYDDASMRPMVDVDLLIDEFNADAADECLQSAGWRPGADLLRSDFYPRFHYEREYVTFEEPVVRVDLHVRPFRPLRFASTIPQNAFLDAAEHADLCGRHVTVPNAEVMLIHLAVHAALHGGGELRWLYDVYSWLRERGDAIDVNDVAERCRKWKLELPMRCALRRVETELGRVSRLRELLDALPRRAGLLDRLVLWQAPHGESRHATDVCVNAFAVRGWRRRIAYLSAVVLPDPGHLEQIYPHRHFAWPIAAHATRAVRVLSRPFKPRAVAAAPR